MKVYALLFLYSLLPSHLLIAQKKAGTQSDFSLNQLGKSPSAALLGHIYDQVLRDQNTAIDREIMLQQKLRYADGETLWLFKTKDSILTALGREYERPMSLRRNVTALENKARDIEDSIIARVSKSNDYYRALSVQFAREVYKNQQSLACLACYVKIRLQKGNQKLAVRMRNYAEQKEIRPPHWEEICDELLGQEVSIEFVSYKSQYSDTIHYGAFLLRKEYLAPVYVALCTQFDLRALLQKGNLNEELFQLLLYQPLEDATNVSLYDLIWQPLESHLKNVKKIIYAPAGDLHRLNIGAISKHENTPPLQDQYEFMRINSTRNLINTYAKTANKKTQVPTIYLPCKAKIAASEALAARFFGNVDVDFYDPALATGVQEAALFGNIVYDMDSVTFLNAKAPVNYLPKPSESTQKTRKRDLNQRSEWDFLYGTKQEIATIQPRLDASEYKVSVYEGYAASEEAFKRLGKGKPSPRVIHLATHGFFLADSSKHADENQMNRCGLILAGANYAWKKGVPLRDWEDGILTAFEISLMNLQNTELVVLSACETGLGYITNNEGVYGLQRAFKQAGVKNLIVSLWSVPDNATQLLMANFYHNCLEKDMGIREALRASQQWMREQEAYKNPYYWAGFVLLE